jgi:hypothetical protein
MDQICTGALGSANSQLGGLSSITGMVTAPTPVAPEDYISAGQPFVKEHLEVKSEEGRAGLQAFANFATVQGLDAAKQICSSTSPASRSLRLPVN